jgi:hypothetical protein
LCVVSLGAFGTNKSQPLHLSYIPHEFGDLGVVYFIFITCGNVIIAKVFMDKTMGTSKCLGIHSPYVQD